MLKRIGLVLLMLVLAACDESETDVNGLLVCRDLVTNVVDTTVVVGASYVETWNNRSQPFARIARPGPNRVIIGRCKFNRMSVAEAPLVRAGEVQPQVYVDTVFLGYTVTRTDTIILTDTLRIEVPATPPIEKVYPIALLMLVLTTCIGFLLWVYRNGGKSNGD